LQRYEKTGTSASLENILSVILPDNGQKFRGCHATGRGGGENDNRIFRGTGEGFFSDFRQISISFYNFGAINKK